MQFGTVAHVAGGGDAARCRYSLVLAHPMPRLDELLAAVGDLSHLTIERDRAAFEYFSDRAAAAKLLAQLIGQQVPVASFSPNAPGIEQAYLRAGIGQVD